VQLHVSSALLPIRVLSEAASQGREINFADVPELTARRSLRFPNIEQQSAQLWSMQC
jgi:hypothetical protein